MGAERLQGLTGRKLRKAFVGVLKLSESAVHLGAQGLKLASKAGAKAAGEARFTNLRKESARITAQLVQFLHGVFRVDFRFLAFTVQAVIFPLAFRVTLRE